MLDNDADASRLDAHVRTLQTIVAALMLGIVMFMGVAVFINVQRAPVAQPQMVLSSLSAGFLAVMVLMWWLVPDWIVSCIVERIAAEMSAPCAVPPPVQQASASPTDASRLLLADQTRTVIASALLEGAAFFGGIAYLIEGQDFTLAVPGVVLALMAFTFPTRDRVSQWLDLQQARINERRSERGA